MTDLKLSSIPGKTAMTGIAMGCYFNILMNQPENQCSPPLLCPYDTLYIYELEGAMPAAKKIFQENFIGSWEEAEGYSFLFFHTPSKARVMAAAGENGCRLRSETVLPWSEWEAGDKIRAFDTGMFRIAPAWEAVPAIEGKRVIMLDPGVAFGSGRHATTRCCLELLGEIAIKGESVPEVADLGAGTGILAIAAAQSLAGRVLAVELNNLCAETARRNVVHNKMEESVLVVQGRAADFLHRPWPLLMANLTYPVIRELVSLPGFRSSRLLLLSGLRPKEFDRLRLQLTAEDFQLRRQITVDSWTTALLTKG